MEKNKILVDAFKWLFIGLLSCFITSYVSMNVEVVNNYIMDNVFIVLGLVVVELILVIVLSAAIKNMSPTLAKILYIIYTMITGFTISWIFLIYTSASIVSIFLATAIVFAIFAYIGKTTQIDLTKFGTYLFIALIAILITTIINLFIGNEMISIITSIAGVVVFSGYIAYDIKFALERSMYIGENAGLYCAFQLFLDFINLFIKLLRLFGKRRD